MAVDPRKYIINRCDTNTDAKKRDFFDSVGNIGDLEVLDDIGLGSISEGLRVLSSVSDSIRTDSRTGDGSSSYNTVLGSILGTARDAVNDGANTVIDSLGLGTAVDAVSQFSPEVANRAYGQAKAIYERVKDGDFSISDVADYVQDFQNLEYLASSIFTDSDSGHRADGDATGVTMCDPSPYATDLIAFAPKFKFLFVVKIEWNPIYSSYFKDLEASFVVKNSTRPNVNVEYEEVNMYNFKTQVPKRVMYQPMTMRFYDDNWNQAMILWTAYLKTISPIANMNFTDQGVASSSVLQESAMDFDALKGSHAYGAPTHEYSASYGVPYDGTTKDIFKRITFFHVYREGRLMNVYQFYNPRIQNFVLDDVDMADGATGTEVEFSFVYDALHITTGYNLNPNTGDGTWNLENLSGSNGRAPHPIVYNGADLVSQNCVTGDINISNAGNSETTASSAKSITETADNLLGQVGNVTDYLSNVFDNSQSSGSRTEATQVSQWIHDSESFFDSKIASLGK